MCVCVYIYYILYIHIQIIDLKGASFEFDALIYMH